MASSDRHERGDKRGEVSGGKGARSTGGKRRFLDRPVCSLNGSDSVDQALKDKIHARLNDPKRFSYEPSTDCWLYCGSWNDQGQAVIRVGVKPYPVSRVAAWLYTEGFELWGANTAVRTCDCPACFNPDHLLVFPDRSSAWRYMLRVCKVGGHPHSRKKKKRPKAA
jgi:hypothetical protein